MKKLLTNTIFFPLFFIGFSVFCSGDLYAQEETEDSPETEGSIFKGKIELSDVDKIIKVYTYDEQTDRYIYRVHVDDFDMEYPLVLTRKEYEDLLMAATMKEYYQKKTAAVDGRLTEEEQKDLLPRYYVNSKLFETIFGGNTIEIKPSGGVEVDLGIRYTKQDNPIISPRNRSTFALDFKPKINVGLKGKIGEYLDVMINYDTQASFGSQQQIVKLNYTPGEDSILQGLEVGNVNMSVNNSLVRGAQNLFGVKSVLQFGPTTFTGVFARQQSERRTIVTEGGGEVRDFELFALDYERDKHFFLSQYFRNKYDDALRNYPYVDSRVRITRVEVWITNRQNRIATTNNNQRNIVALQDIGEARSSTIPVDRIVGIDVNANPTFFGNSGLDVPSDNNNNKFDPENIGTNFLNENVRQINTVLSGFNIPVTEGRDFVKLENARKLNENEFKFHPQLGYISLQQSLSNDEVLAVAYEYTIGDKIYKVGEFATDGVNSTVISQNQNNEDIPTTQSLIVKLLKSSLTATEEPVWDLMMKNIYRLDGAYNIAQEGFRFNIMYTDPQPLNYIKPVGSTPLPADVQETPLLNVFHLDRLNNTNDPQVGGDGYFDFVANSLSTNGMANNSSQNNSSGGYSNNNNNRLQNTNRFEGITIDPQNGRIIFTTVEPFGEHLFKKLSSNASENYYNDASFNDNQKKYVYKSLYRNSYAKALQDTEKNKFQLKGKFRGEGSDGIYVGSSNLQPGSVVVSTGGRILSEGADYTVDYQRGYVSIIDPSLQNSNTPIEVSVETNSTFSLQRRNFYGIDINHKFSEDFNIGATYLTLVEQPTTSKSNYDNTSVNNSIFGFNINYSTEAPFLTRWVNKLPNIDTDVPSRFSIKGDFAYLKPGASTIDQMNNEATAHIDNFESTQTNIDLMSSTSWKLSSVPVGFGEQFSTVQSGYRRSKLSWYTIDQVFHSPSLRPSGITDNHVSSNKTRRIYKSELFPNMDLAAGDLLVVNTLDLSYYPTERGPYNYNPSFLANNNLPNPQNNWAGIMRSISTTNFENANVEYIEFWMMDPYTGNAGDTASDVNSGKLVFNLGYISEDILQDGFKQYENGLPGGSSSSPTMSTIWGKVPASTALIYAFDTDANNRAFQDAGLDGILDDEEANLFPDFARYDDPAADNYEYFLNASGDILQRYKNYNGLQGNNPIEFSDTNRGNNTLPDVEDIDNDNTMNTINAYFQYEVNVSSNPTIGQNYVVDVQTSTQTMKNGATTPVKWVQYKIPISTDPQFAVGAISDLQSIRFVRMYVTGFVEPVTLRLGALNLVRSDWRRYTETLIEDPTNVVLGTNTGFDVTTLNIINNSSRDPIPYVLPPGLVREQVNQNNTVINKNEQSLSLRVYKQSQNSTASNGLEPGDSRAVFKNFDFDMREYKKMRMFTHAEALEPNTDSNRLQDDELVAFIRFGNDFTNNFYQVEYPLKVTDWGQTAPEEIWPTVNEMELRLELLNKVKLSRNNDRNADPNLIYFKDEVELDPQSITRPNQLKIGIKGNPNFGRVRTVMLGVRNNTDVLYQNSAQTERDVRGEVWFNELRASDLDEKGGWAAVVSMDTQIADFATVAASVNKSTVGFGSIEQMPQERSREDVFQYNIATSVNTHQLLPKKWNLNLPVSYSISEEKITPEYDPNNPDLRLKDVIENASSSAEKDVIKSRAIDYTKRTSINLIGWRKNLGNNQTPKFYNIENFTVSQSFNEMEQRNFEIERTVDQQTRTSVDYSYAFKPFNIEPFKNAGNWKNNQYLKLITDFNLNPLPTAINFNANVLRQFNSQKYRMIDVEGIEIQPLFRRNFFFNYNYGMNFNLTKALNVTYNVSNNNIVKNYLFDDGRVNNSLGIWDGYFDVGDPNNRMQQFSVNYELPFSKIPFLKFIKSTYSYTGDYSWTRASTAFRSIDYDGINYDLGNTIQNANSHRLNASLNLDTFYKYIGLVPSSEVPKKTPTPAQKPKPGQKIEKQTASKEEKESEPSALLDAGIKIITGIKTVGITYNETNGTVLPGFLPGLGFFGSTKPTLGFVFGDQSDIRYESAKRGWLTTYPEFNQTYSEVSSKRLEFNFDYKPVKNLTIDFRGRRQESLNMSEQYDVTNGVYNSRAPFEFGYFEISTNMIATAFSSSNENSSKVFDQFRNNRLEVANRLATERGIDITDSNNLDEYGFPKGYGRTSQEVLIPSFLAAYQGKSVGSVKSGFFSKIPIPGWRLRYTGLTDIGWFKERFKRVTIEHGYESSYTVNSYQTNYEYLQDPEKLDAAGNYPSKIVASNINLLERFNPLIKVEFDTKRDFKFITTVNRNRSLSMSFDNNLLTEMTGMDYRAEVGFRIRDVAIQTDFEGVENNGRIVSDIDVKLGLRWQQNKTLMRFLDYNNNQVGAGQDEWGITAAADYRFSKNFVGAFYYEHRFSKAVISTMFPVTNIRTGFTLRYNFGN